MGGLLGSVGTDLSDMMNFFVELTNPHTWLRVFFIILGFALVIMSFKVGGVA